MYEFSAITMGQISHQKMFAADKHAAEPELSFYGPCIFYKSITYLIWCQRRAVDRISNIHTLMFGSLWRDLAALNTCLSLSSPKTNWNINILTYQVFYKFIYLTSLMMSSKPSRNDELIFWLGLNSLWE